MPKVFALIKSYLTVKTKMICRLRRLPRTLTVVFAILIKMLSESAGAAEAKMSASVAANSAALRCSESIFFPKEVIRLGEGTTSEVYMVRQDGKVPFVHKEYRAAVDRVNDELALDYLKKLFATQAGKEIGFKVIKILGPKVRAKGDRSLHLEYWSGFELSESAKLVPQLRDEYVLRLHKLDKILRQSGHLAERFQFSYGGLPAIQYSFSANRDFQIIIHAKNILVTEDGFVIIDPY